MKNLKINELEEGLYLIKVPCVIYNYIENLPNKASIGNINNCIIKQQQITNNPYNSKNSNLLNKKKSFSINLNKSFPVTNFELTVDKAYETFAFKDKKNKIKEVDFSGRFIAKDEITSSYITEKINEEEENKKKITLIEKEKGRPRSEGVLKLSEYHFQATIENKEKAILQKNRKEKNLKKTRKDKEVLKNEVFDLFSEKNIWTTKELIEKLDQPENYLKEVLSEICNFIRSGPNKGSFELKKQFELNLQE